MPTRAKVLEVLDTVHAHSQPDAQPTVAAVYRATLADDGLGELLEVADELLLERDLRGTDGAVEAALGELGRALLKARAAAALARRESPEPEADEGLLERLLLGVWERFLAAASSWGDEDLVAEVRALYELTEE